MFDYKDLMDMIERSFKDQIDVATNVIAAQSIREPILVKVEVGPMTALYQCDPGSDDDNMEFRLVQTMTPDRFPAFVTVEFEMGVN